MSSSGGGVIIIHNSVPGHPPVHVPHDEFAALIALLPDGPLKDKLTALLNAE